MEVQDEAEGARRSGLAGRRTWSGEAGSEGDSEDCQRRGEEEAGTVYLAMWGHSSHLARPLSPSGPFLSFPVL